MAAKMLPKANVLWWDDQDAVVRCPYCCSWHRHFVTKGLKEDENDIAQDVVVDRLIEYNQRSHRSSPCMVSFPTQYTLAFPLSNYEIEKPWQPGDKARFVSIVRDVGRVPSMSAWESRPPFGDLQREFAMVEELEVAEWEYHEARARSIPADTVLLDFKDPSMSTNDPQLNARSRLEKCEDELRTAKKRYKTALSLCLAPSSDSRKSTDTAKNLGTSMKDVVKAIRCCCREYRLLAFYREARSEIDGRGKTKTEDAVDDILETFSRLEVAAESLEHPFSQAEDRQNEEVNDKTETIRPKLCALSRDEPNNTVALLKYGARADYLEVMSGKKDQTLPWPDRNAPSLLAQVFDLAEDIGFEFVDWKEIDAEKIESGIDPEWRVGQYNACHAESKATALFISRHTFILKERGEGHPLYQLWKARPLKSTTKATIYVDHEEVCPSCRCFIKAVNAALGTSIGAQCIPCKQRFRWKKGDTIQLTLGDLVRIPLRVSSTTERAAMPLPSVTTASPETLPSESEEEARSEADIMDELTGWMSSMSVISRSEIRVLETNGEISQASEVAPWRPRPQTPPRRLSSTSQFSSGSRRSSYTSSGAPRSPRKPVVCFNCGADHYSTCCRNPKTSREQQQIHREEARKQQAEWKRRMSGETRTNQGRENEMSTTSMSTELQPRRLFGSGRRQE